MNIIAATQAINWRRVTSGSPEEGSLVAVSGRYPQAPGRWVRLAHRVGHSFFSDETGDALMDPDYWHEIILPEDD